MALDFKAMMAAERAKRRKGAADGESDQPKPAASLAPKSEGSAAARILYTLPKRDSRPVLSAAHLIPSAPSAIYHVPDWLSVEEEDALLRCVDSTPVHGCGRYSVRSGWCPRHGVVAASKFRRPGVWLDC